MSQEEMVLEGSGSPTPDNDTVDEASILLTEIKKYIKKVQLTSETKELRYLQRAMRYVFSQFRHKQTPEILSSLVDTYFPLTHERREILARLLPPVASTEEKERSTKQISPEVEVFISLLVLVHLIDSKRIDEAVTFSSQLIELLGTWNRRTLDPLSAKVFFYYSRSYELHGQLETIRPTLLALQRTATLRHNFDGQISLLNLLLRNYLAYNLYEMADKLAAKSELKESVATSNELARYYFYLGRIKSVQLNYQEAYWNLQQALRKAPTQGALGFKASVIKLTSIIQLLLGEIPERSIFYQKGLTSILKPYLALTSAVRKGDLDTFQKCVDKYIEDFKRDKNLTLILRMRNTVIMTGLLKINLSYSRIRFEDICEKLKLESVEDAEYIISKAIKDGIIDATINHAEGYIQSKDLGDVYATDEPQKQFNKRIQQFLDIHNEAIKAMRYRPDSKKHEDDEEYKRKQKEEDELANALAVDDDFF